MLKTALRKIFGSANDRQVKKYRKIVEKINALEPKYQGLSDEELQQQTGVLKARLQQGETLEDIKCDAFAVVRETAKRVLGERHYDVQLIGGLTLHDGCVAEMKTGEGKTLVATLPSYLNGLSGKGVHVVTVNDYLAKRDAEWVGRVHRFLGLEVGYIVHGLTDTQRRKAYNADVTYGTNHEFGFDYLRDNMKFRIEDMVMRDFNFAIVDEVDSILVDEARTPLIISGPAEKSSDYYMIADHVIKQLDDTHYEKDEKQKNVTFTDAGVEKVEEILKELELLKGKSLYDIQNVQLVHYINASLKANCMYKQDIDYIIKDDEIVIIDEFTGRMMEGRRYSEGLHQAIEAKEGVTIQIENQTLASITYQNYFRLYPKLSGMSGTVMTESDEFDEIYKLRCIKIPTNRPIKRIDQNDEFYVSQEEKYEAVIKIIHKCHEKGQPVLVGTTSIEKSEYLSFLLHKAGIKHSVLNARYHEQEAVIVASAGRLGAVTIATNMAGRGTDIKLGGSFDVRYQDAIEGVESEEEQQRIKEKVKEEIAAEQKKVLEAGGLYVIGTERHESRRIDNQLLGRSGRQGDPGESQFFLSIHDDLLRIFGFDKKQDYLRKKMKEGEKYSNWMFNHVVESAQRKVEARNFDMRKHLLKYDDVMNEQRKIIYGQRREFMRAADLKGLVYDMKEEIIDELVTFYVPEHSLQDMWDLEGLQKEVHRIFSIDLPIAEWGDSSVELIKQHIQEAVSAFFDTRYESIAPDVISFLEKNTLLQLLDKYWKDHLYYLDQLRQGINLRAYAQSNPLNEYKREAFQAFEHMMSSLRMEIMEVLSHMPLDSTVPSLDNDDFDFDFNFDEPFDEDKFMQAFESHAFPTNDMPPDARLGASSSLGVGGAEPKKQYSRNELCFCGSGKRYKHCHGQIKSDSY